MRATKIIRDREYGSWAVQVFDEKSGRYYWLDVNYDEKYKELSIDWNQYIFYNTDEDDTARKAFQENGDNFDEAISVVSWALVCDSEVRENENGYEIIVEEWKAKSWLIK